MKDTIVKAVGAPVPQEWIERLKVPGRPEMKYVPIDKTIRRFNEALGDQWSVTVTDQSVVQLGDRIIATVAIEIHVMDAEVATVRAGIGSDQWKINPNKPNADADIDKMVKTAYANAVKKAANMFGFAAELWDEEAAPAAAEQAHAEGPAFATLKLSDKSREKLSVLIAETNLTKAEVSDFATTLFPESKGYVSYFASLPNEEEMIDKFIAQIKAAAAAKK